MENTEGVLLINFRLLQIQIEPQYRGGKKIVWPKKRQSAFVKEGCK